MLAVSLYYSMPTEHVADCQQALMSNTEMNLNRTLHGIEECWFLPAPA